MASYLLDKLETLKAEENEIKERQRILEDEVEFEMEKQRRLEMDGTIAKLRTQIGEISKNIEGEIMPNNIAVLWENPSTALSHTWDSPIGGNRNKGGHKRHKRWSQRQQLQDKRDRRRGSQRQQLQDPQFITLKEFQNNLKKIDNQSIDLILRGAHASTNGPIISKQMVYVKPEIKIYDDIIPIFTTMMSIMKKQGEEIQKLKPQSVIV